MKAAILEKYGDPLKIVDIDKPKVDSNSVLIRISGCGVCHSDVHLWKGELSSILPTYLPIVPGHEASGIVEEVGSNVPPHIQPGLEVILYWSYCEQEDRYTEQGLYQYCSLKAPAGFIAHNGCYAEYMLIPHYRYLVSADGLDDLESASILSCAGTTSYSAVKKALSNVGVDEYIVIVGLGGLGILALQIARALSGARIIGVDIRREAVDMASRIVRLARGDVLIDASKDDPRKLILEATDGEAPKAILDFVGSYNTIETYLDLLVQRGIYVIVGLASEYGPRIPIHLMVTRELSITTVYYGSISDLRSVIDLARRKIINYKDMVKKIKLKDVNTALENLSKGKALARQVITF